MQVAVPPILLPFVRHYLFLESPEKSSRKLRLFSDGSTGIVFSVNNKLFTASSECQKTNILPPSFLYGQITNYRDIYADGEILLIIIVFQPAGLHHLLGIPGKLLQNQVFSLNDILGNEGTVLESKLLEASGIQQKTDILNTFFCHLASQTSSQNHLLIDAAVRYIQQNNGLVSVGKLSKFTGYTERHIERKFQECIGISPQKFGNLIRLHHFLKSLKNNSTNQSFTALAYESGYTDQSHLIKEFRKITGFTPTLYSGNSHKLAINFLEL